MVGSSRTKHITCSSTSSQLESYFLSYCSSELQIVLQARSSMGHLDNHPVVIVLASSHLESQYVKATAPLSSRWMMLSSGGLW